MPCLSNSILLTHHHNGLPCVNDEDQRLLGRFTPMKTFRALLDQPPKTVAWSDVVDFNRLDERRSYIDCLHANILGVNDGYVEWSPNDSPPSKAETLAWLWFIRPDLGDEIASDAPAPLRNLIQKFQAGDMKTWWKEMTQPYHALPLGR